MQTEEVLVIEVEEVKEPERTSGCLELASGGGVLVLDAAAPAVEQRQAMRRSRRKQLPAEETPR